MRGVRIPANMIAVPTDHRDRSSERSDVLAAAVIGKDVPFAVLEAIAEVPEDVLRHGLASLQAGEFLHEARLFPDLEYTFKHALTHEVAYGSLLQDRRRALHARIVEAIETLSAGRLAEHVERLAHHATRGEVWERAVALPPPGRDQGVRGIGQSGSRPPASHRPWTLWRICRRRARRPSRASICGSISATRSISTESSSGAESSSFRLNTWPGHLMIGGGLGG